MVRPGVSHRGGAGYASERIDLVAAHQPGQRAAGSGRGVPDAGPVRVAGGGRKQVGPRRHALVGTRKALEPARRQLQGQEGMGPRLRRLLAYGRRLAGA